MSTSTTPVATFSIRWSADISRSIPASSFAGWISQYNLKDAPPGPNLGPVVSKRAKIIGLVVYDFEDRRDDFLREAIPWFQAGKLKYKEEISDGIETAPEVFARLLGGKNFGKTIIKVGLDPTAPD